MITEPECTNETGEHFFIAYELDLYEECVDCLYRRRKVEKEDD